MLLILFSKNNCQKYLVISKNNVNFALQKSNIELPRQEDKVGHKNHDNLKTHRNRPQLDSSNSINKGLQNPQQA